MPQLYHDVLFCSIFTIVLIVLAKYRGTVFSRDLAAYRRIVIGLFFFLGFSLVQLAGNQGKFSGIVYLGDPVGRKVVEAFGILGGLVFLLSGISAWLPSLARNRNERQRLNKRYYCLKMVNEALESGQSLDEKYDKLRSCLVNYLGFADCGLYKYSSRKDTLYLSSPTPGVSGNHDFQVKLPLSDSPLKTELLGFRTVIGHLTSSEQAQSDGSEIVVPVSYQDRLYGAIICRTDRQIIIDDDLMDFVSTIGLMTGRQNHLQVAEVRSQLIHTQLNVYERIGRLCSRFTTLGEAVPNLFKEIGELVGAEYLSVASLDNSGENMMCYTVGSGGRVLLERGISRQTRGTDIYKVYETGRTILNSEVTADDGSDERDGLFLSCGMHSRMICPVRVGEKVIGVLTLGYSHPNHYTSLHLNRIERVSDLIGSVIQREQLSRNVETREDHMLRLQLMQHQMLDDPPAQELFNDACELLTRRMNCTVARISLLDRDQKNLISQACRSVREVGHDLHAEEPIPLSLLPWHRMALDARKLMLINQDDPESRMPPQESTSSLIPNIKSAMLVPIMLNDKVKGIISVGEARNWNRRRFGATDLIFARDLAAKCSLALQMKRLQMEVDKGREELRQSSLLSDDFSSDLRFRIKSPLTSIMGAVELLRLKGSGDDSSTRYYDMILKSADRIRSMTDGYPEEIAENEEVNPEQVIG